MVLKVEGRQKAMWEESWEPVWALRGSSKEVFTAFPATIKSSSWGPSPIMQISEDIIVL